MIEFQKCLGMGFHRTTGSAKSQARSDQSRATNCSRHRTMFPIIPFLFDEQSKFPVVTPWKTTIDHQTAAASTLTGHTESRHEDETTVPCDQGERQGDDIENESSNDSLSTESSDESEEIPIDSIITIRTEKNEGVAFELVRNEPKTTALSTLSSDECLTYLGQEVELEKSNKATTSLAKRNSHNYPVTTLASKIDIRVSRQHKIPLNVKANDDSGPMSYANMSRTRSRRKKSVFHPSIPSPRKVDATLMGATDATPGLSEPNKDLDTHMKDLEECTLCSHNTTVTDASGSHFTLDMLGHYFCRCNAGGTEVDSGDSLNSALGKAVQQYLVSADSSESKDSTIAPMEIFQQALEEVGMSARFCALEDGNTLLDSEGILTPEDEKYDTEAVPRAMEPVGDSVSGKEIKKEAGVARRSTRKKRLPRIKFFRSPFRRKGKSTSISHDDPFLEGLIAREVDKMELCAKIYDNEPSESGTIPSGLSDLLEAVIEEEDGF
mmetsp:Transcript_29207/g.69552  ORF Transcript_29207/g.69552 Transcript_29207/m.69552 type:complete len:494 (-) Transcript_29207:46-1527(-)